MQRQQGIQIGKSGMRKLAPLSAAPKRSKKHSKKRPPKTKRKLGNKNKHKDVGKSVKTLVQIGANIGLDHFFNHCKCLEERCKIFLIEPNFRLIDQLKENWADLSQQHDIKIFNIGIVNERNKNTNTLFIYPNDTGLGSILHRRSHNYVIETIQFVPKLFSTFCEENNINEIDLLTIDTEGFDYELLYSFDIEKINIKEIFFESWQYDNDDIEEKVRSGPSFLPKVIEKYSNYGLEYMVLDGCASYKLIKGKITKKLFDIGANVGNYTLSNLDKYDTFIMVEPNPSLQHLLEGIKLNNQNKNMHIEQRAVTNKSCVDFYVCDYDTISTCNIEWFEDSRFSNIINKHKTLNVDGIKIDDLVKKYGSPDHIKIDVEGYENVAIKTMTQKYCPLSFEWAEECVIYYEILTYLNNLGYTRFQVLVNSDNYNHIPHYDLTYDGCCSWFKNNTNENKKEQWGMVYAE